jgi:hypothetical protein
MILGLATAYLALAAAQSSSLPLRFDRRLVSRTTAACTVAILGAYVYVRLAAR